jgi:sterol desaturase/sphingolipid hydroxylase (fatty acid hydroxylase superfamily)
MLQVLNDYGVSTWATYVAGITIARVATLQIAQGISRSKMADSTRITKRPVINEKQHQRESVWPLGFALDALVLVAMFYFTRFSEMAAFDIKAFLVQFAIHCTVVEFVYYWLHRALHWKWIYQMWHQYHHQSVNTEPTTSLSFELGERLVYTVLFAVTPLGTYLLGYQSYASLAFHLLWFDVMNFIGHINFEFFPRWYMESPLALVWYTPSYHSIHHTRFRKNYSLFMTWPDLMFGTADMSKTRDVFWEALGIEEGPNANELTDDEYKPKDFGFIVHAVHLSSYLHSPYVLWCTRLHNKVYDPERYWMYLFAPVFLVCYLFTSYFSYESFNIEEEFTWGLTSRDTDGQERVLRGITTIVRNPAIDYFMPFKYRQINHRITNAILELQRRNTRFVGLAALNKAEWLNHGGVDILKLAGDKLHSTYIAHGDTMTAAVVLNFVLNLRERNFWKHSALVIGATSKIGRAICLAFAKRKIHTLMFTTSQERFEYIRNEAGEDGIYLERIEHLDQGKDCDMWITGKFKPGGFELLNAIPKNTTVLNFAVPDPLTDAQCRTRPDILHLDAGFLSYDTKRVNMDFTALLPAGIIYACMGGCVVHAAMGFPEHEIGAVRMDRLEMYWEKGLECGFSLPPPMSFSRPVQIPDFRVEEI